MLIILITGVAHSGKDTVAAHLAKRMRSRGMQFAQVALADALKIVCQKLVSLFYGVDIPLADFHDIARKEEVRTDLPYFAGAPFKIRTLLQQVGTDVIREHVSHDVWCDHVRANYIEERKYDVLVISDMRTLAEHEYFMRMSKHHDIVSIRVTRNIASGTDSVAPESRAHQSERDIPLIQVDYELANNGTREELYAQIDEILKVVY